ncbi:unknown [Tannerella sp. CAG:51]|nr:unknown [Tannerella sp. CAG:51]
MRVEASSSTIEGQAAAGTANIASSVFGNDVMSGKQGIPCTSVSFGFTAYNFPGNFPSSRFRIIFPPGFCVLFDPPMITILSGAINSLLIIIYKILYFR